MAEERYVQKNIRFPEGDWDRLENALGPKENRSEFVRDAVREKLDRKDASAIPDVLRLLQTELASLRARLDRLEGRE